MYRRVQPPAILSAMHATFHTTAGDFTVELLEKDAPHTVENFVKLVRSGFYDGTRFHRIIKGFMIQGGDPQTKDEGLAARWGTGGPGYTFADEIHANNRNTVGTLSMANAGPDTNGSQFFVNTADNHFLDTRHTVFGSVTDGIETVRALEAVPTGAMDRPLDPPTITSIELS